MVNRDWLISVCMMLCMFRDMLKISKEKQNRFQVVMTVESASFHLGIYVCPKLKSSVAQSIPDFQSSPMAACVTYRPVQMQKSNVMIESKTDGFTGTDGSDPCP
jgi:hypothetical protein